MSNFDLVEKLRERANVSYEDARAALGASGGDLLEALIYLEKQGKVAPPSGGGSYSSKGEASARKPAKPAYQDKEKGETFTELLNRFFGWCGKVLHSGNTNQFEVWRHNQKILAMPITVLVLLVVFASWVAIPLLVIGLFLSCRYAFSGSSIKSVDVNSVMDSAADAAEGIKNEFKSHAHDCGHRDDSQK